MDNSYKKALIYEYFTIGYNMIEAVASIFFGTLAGSIALVGFGLDSIVESLSGFVLVWRLKKHDNLSEEEEEKIEKKAVRFVGITFFILGIYVLYESISKIVMQEVPDPSLPGIIIAIISMIIMPVLAYKKYSLGKKMGLASLVADSKETMVCSVLSLALFLGLAGNYFWGFWLADPIAGIVIVVFLFKEGLELLNEDHDE